MTKEKVYPWDEYHRSKMAPMKMKAWLMEQEERGVYTSDEARDIWFLRNYGVDVSGIRRRKVDRR